MNVITLMGRLTAAPELKTTQSGVAVTSFTLAVDRNYTPKGQEKQTDFINCVAWRNTAEFIAKYFQKGSRMAVKGELQQRNYTTQGGEKRTIYEVIVDAAYFCESKSEKAVPNIPYAEEQPAFTTPTVDYEDITSDDDIPF